MNTTNTKLAVWMATAAALALPGSAQAGTGTAAGAAAMTIAPQCSVTGADVSLGTYTTAQTIGDVAAHVGYWAPPEGMELVPGAVGEGEMSLGSVTCDAGAPYSLTIAGNSIGDWDGVNVGFELGGKLLRASVWANRIGDTLLGSNFVGSASSWWISYRPASAVGTGLPQDIRGNVFLEMEPGGGTTVTFSDPIGGPGVYAAALLYTLNF